MIEITSRCEAAVQEQEQGIVQALQAALRYEGRQGDISLVLVGPEEIQQLNREYRGIDRVTDVLSFPALEGELLLAPPGYLGDIAICYARAVEQAKEYGHSLERELAFLAVHGALHLMGYDHMTPEDENEMVRRQKEILNKMGVMR